MLILTNDMVLDDIAGFEQRIQAAREKLAELPTGHLPYKRHKHREKQQRDLQAEIKHVERLIEYGKEALQEC